MDNLTVKIKIDVMSDGSTKLFTPQGEELTEMIDSETLAKLLREKTIDDVLVTPMFTYLNTGFCVFIINGRAFRVPC